MTQPLLFDNPPAHARARRHDPQSSKDAAAAVELSGVANSQRALVLKALREGGPGTSREIARRCLLDRYQVARRCPELARDGLIVAGPVRPCTAGGMRGVEWRIV